MKKQKLRKVSYSNKNTPVNIGVFGTWELDKTLW